MTQALPACPHCKGPSEFNPEDGGEYFCSFCQWSKSVHPPWTALLDLFWRPRYAGRRIRRHPPALSALLLSILCTASSVARLGQTPAWERLSARFSWLAALSQHSVTAVVGGTLIALALQTVVAAFIYGAAKLMDGDGEFVPLWTAFIALTAVATGVGAALPHGTRAVGWILAGLKMVLLVGAIQGIYELDLGRALGSWAIAWGFQYFMIFVVGIVGALAMFKNPNTISDSMPTAAPETIQEPASYNWTVRSLDGKTLSAQDLKGKTVLINMWATWCFPCRMEMPSLQKLFDRMTGSGVVIMAVSDEEPAKVARYIEKNRYTFPVYTHEGAWPQGFEFEGLPATFILSKEGKIVRRHIGANNWAAPEIIATLKSLAAGGSNS